MIHHMSPEQLNVSRIEKSQNSAKSIQQVKGTKEFKDLLAEKLQSSELKFSSHATKRLAMRGIELTEKDLESLKNAIDLAESKGSRDTLVMHEKASFVVSVKNRTVITAIDDMSMKEKIVTNIDSAVLAQSL